MTNESPEISNGLWDAFDAGQWASVFGFIKSPLFSQSAPQDQSDSWVLLDGMKTSFAFVNGLEPSAPAMDALSWTWSANLNHLITPSQSEGRLYLRRWDDPTLLRRFSAPVGRAEAARLLDTIARQPTPKSPGVIDHVMQIFRYLHGQFEDASVSIRLLDGLLLAAREVALRHVEPGSIGQASSYEQILDLIPDELSERVEINDLPQSVRSASPQEVTRFLVEREPYSGCYLRADILFRHAASQLFQEAHFALERQSFFIGMSLPPTGRPWSTEVRYTPPNLARSLAEEALKWIDRSTLQDGRLAVLDPACGSGVFLVEMARAVELTNNAPEVTLLGYDQSAAATTIARSCLALAHSEQRSSSVHWEITERNALEGEWDKVDLILMNPPFRAWSDMSPEDQGNVSDALGDIGAGRRDKAMAFLWKAWQHLKPGGVLATVLPAPLLDNKSARPLREAIQSDAVLRLIGRFKGFSYFANSMVETAFVVIQKKITAQRPKIDVLLADKGFEEHALRALRTRNDTHALDWKQIELFKVKSRALPQGSWLPRSKREMQLVEMLESTLLPTVSDLFRVHQGVRTSRKQTFLLTADEHSRLPKRERKYFRPAAGQGSVKNGVLQERQYIFYPYGPGGPLLTSVEELQHAVPEYFEQWLFPLKNELKRRQGESEWWLLTRSRPWQYERQRKLVSTYFGSSGSFAYDSSGQFVVVNGYAWLAKEEPPDGESREDYEDRIEAINWSYLAVLNSRVFGRIIECYSWKLQGGQLRLEARFLEKVPLPDLFRNDDVSDLVRRELHNFGRQIDQGDLSAIVDELDEIVLSLYHLPMEILAT